VTNLRRSSALTSAPSCQIAVTLLLLSDFGSTFKTGNGPMVAGSYLGNCCQDLSTCNTLSSFQSVSTIELIARYRTKHSHQRVLENMIGMNRLSRGVVMLAGSWETPGIIPPLSRKATTSSGLYCYSQCCRIPLQ